jgi:hypothetical protein
MGLVDPGAVQITYIKLRTSNYINALNIFVQILEDEWTRTNIYALSRIRTHGLSVQAIKAHASARAVYNGVSTECFTRYWPQSFSYNF